MEHTDITIKNLNISMLLDFYGQLLTGKAQEMMELYYNEDMSLSEISDHYKITRQGVHDMIKRSIAALESYEEKLKLVSRFSQQHTCILEAINDLEENHPKQAKERLLTLNAIL